MPTVSFEGLPARDAIKFIQDKRKNLVLTDRWDDMLGTAHAKAFTVAGATKADLLTDLYGSVEQAIREGQSISQFRKNFDKAVQDHGWQYKGKRGWRTRVIYDMNMRSAHAAGKWQKIQATKKVMPYLVYMTVGDENVRESHAKWHRIALPIDDPWWTTHYPPNDWGCRCYVIQASEAMLKRMGIDVLKTSPDLKPTERINTRTGEVYGEVPQGIGVGFDYNVGMAWMGPDIALGKHLATMDPVILEATTLVTSSLIAAKNTEWQNWLRRVEDDGKPRGSQIGIGYLDNNTLAKLEERGIKPDNAAITIYDKQLNHLQGKHKGKAKRVTDDILNNLPQRLRDYQSVYIHTDSQSLVLVFPDDLGNKKARAVIQLDFSRKGQLLNSIRSLGVMDIKNIKQGSYEHVLGDKL